MWPELLAISETFLLVFAPNECKVTDATSVHVSIASILIGQFFYSLKNLILVLLQSHVNLIAKPFIE